MRRHLKTAIGVAVSLLLLWWIFRGEDPGAIARRIAQADPLLLAAAVLVATLGYLLRAFRWALLLEPTGVRGSLHHRWMAICIGFMANNLLPARVGEFARAFAMGRMEPIPASAAFGTLAVERFLDAVALLGLLGLLLLSPAFPEGATVGGRSVSGVVLGLVGILSILVIFYIVVLSFPALVLRWARKLMWPFSRSTRKKVVGALRAFIDGLAVFRRPGLLIGATLWSFAVWLWMSWSFWIAFRAFGIELGMTAAIFTQCAVSLFVALPAAPGFFGTFHAGVAVSLEEVFGVAAEPTLSLAVGYHIGGFIPVTVLGLLYAGRIGMTLSEIRDEEVPTPDRAGPPGGTSQDGSDPGPGAKTPTEEER